MDAVLLCEILYMKKLLVLFSVLSLILFVDYIVIAVIGCFANVCGAKEGFYCGMFCYIALAVVTTSIFLSLYFWSHNKVKLQG